MTAEQMVRLQDDVNNAIFNQALAEDYVFPTATRREPGPLQRSEP